MKGWSKIKPAAEYFGVSGKTMRQWIKDGFPHVRLGSGTVLINFDKGDAYLWEKFGDQDGDDQSVLSLVDKL